MGFALSTASPTTFHRGHTIAYNLSLENQVLVQKKPTQESGDKNLNTSGAMEAKEAGG